MQKYWSLKEAPSKLDVKFLSSVLNVSPRIASLLLLRGIKTFEEAKTFFRPNAEQLHDPFLIKDMGRAVSRLEQAIEKNERLLVYGDYDVDGTTAVSLVYSFFESLGARVEYYIPDRYAEGYGISKKGIDYANENGFSLVISLDCGIKAEDEIEYARSRGIDFIVCDHHRPSDKLPPAYAVLDPKRADCSYPFKELSGCAIGFKLVQAYLISQGDSTESVFKYLDYVAISLACDLVPLTGENRVLALMGLELMNRGKQRLGVKALIDRQAMSKDITITDLVFVVGPKINAAGRIDDAKDAVKLLISKDASFAKEMGDFISEQNNVRKQLDKEATEQALFILEKDDWFKSASSTVVYDKDWHKGIIGIVASRLIETHYKPTIVLTESNGKVAGSARSVKGFDVYKAIESCQEFIEQFGGHKYAAGLTMNKENISSFRVKFDEVVRNTIAKEQLIPTIDIDEQISFQDITTKFYRILSQMGPFGPGNMKPVFVTRNVMNAGGTRIVGSDESHLRLEVVQDGVTFSGIAFGMADKLELVTTGFPIDLVYSLDLNEWAGTTSIQLMVKDIRQTDC